MRYIFCMIIATAFPLIGMDPSGHHPQKSHRHHHKKPLTLTEKDLLAKAANSFSHADKDKFLDQLSKDPQKALLENKAAARHRLCSKSGTLPGMDLDLSAPLPSATEKPTLIKDLDMVAIQGVTESQAIAFVNGKTILVETHKTNNTDKL